MNSPDVPAARNQKPLKIKSACATQYFDTIHGQCAKCAHANTSIPRPEKRRPLSFHLCRTLHAHRVASFPAATDPHAHVFADVGETTTHTHTLYQSCAAATQLNCNRNRISSSYQNPKARRRRRRARADHLI